MRYSPGVVPGGFEAGGGVGLVEVIRGDVERIADRRYVDHCPDGSTQSLGPKHQRCSAAFALTEGDSLTQ